eukprot:429382-Alexandrium_andersonii.AAC.1
MQTATIATSATCDLPCRDDESQGHECERRSQPVPGGAPQLKFTPTLTDQYGVHAKFMQLSNGLRCSGVLAHTC